MSRTQMLAWIICLLVAFLACVMAAKATYRTAMLERDFAAVQEAAAVHSAALDRISEVLDRLDTRMEFIGASRAVRAQMKDGAGAAESDPAADRAVE